jgi:hypothetical protein
MKIKLLAVMVLFLALGINTTEAQNRRYKEKHQSGQRDRKDGGFSKRDRDGKFRKGDKKFRSEKMMKHRHRKEFRRDKRHDRRHVFHKRYRRTHRF